MVRALLAERYNLGMSASPAAGDPTSLPNPDDDSLSALSTAGDARITIRRESPDDVGFREIFVSIDGDQVAILRSNETFTKDIPPGRHRLRAHNTLFWKTHDLELGPGEHASFVAINKAGPGTFGFMIFLGASPVYLTFERDK